MMYNYIPRRRLLTAVSSNVLGNVTLNKTKIISILTIGVIVTPKKLGAAVVVSSATTVVVSVSDG